MSTLDLRTIGRVAVGSTNPVKLDAVRAVVLPLAPAATVVGTDVASGVRDQPWGDAETIRGARTRAEAARQALDADLGVGIEGGVVDMEDGSLRTCAWAVIIGRNGQAGTGGSLAMLLPPVIARDVRDGLELGAAMDRATGGRDTKRGQGAVGILTAGLVDRRRAYEVLVAYALAPFITPRLWDSA